MIRTAGILQLLLGNIGRPGGGIMAMRGHSTIQGSTDLATLYDVLPGYLPQPYADENHETLDSYVEHEGMPTGYWSNFRKFVVSLLKAWYGDAATPENDFCFSWLPRVDDDYSQLPYFDRMSKGGVKGFFLFGQNPAGAHRTRACIARDCATSTGWWCSTGSRSRAPCSGRTTRVLPHPPTSRPKVFFIPAAAAPEKEGSLTNTQRLLQWHDKALDPLGDSRSDAWFLYNFGKRIKQLYAGLDRPQGPTAAAPHLGLRLRPAAAAARRQPQPHRGRAGPGEGAHGDQWVPVG
jgi:formate dehydrogenase major subunit